MVHLCSIDRTFCTCNDLKCINVLQWKVILNRVDYKRAHRELNRSSSFALKTDRRMKTDERNDDRMNRPIRKLCDEAKGNFSLCPNWINLKTTIYRLVTFSVTRTYDKLTPDTHWMLERVDVIADRSSPTRYRLLLGRFFDILYGCVQTRIVVLAFLHL